MNGMVQVFAQVRCRYVHFDQMEFLLFFELSRRRIVYVFQSNSHVRVIRLLSVESETHSKNCIQIQLIAKARQWRFNAYNLAYNCQLDRNIQDFFLLLTEIS